MGFRKQQRSIYAYCAGLGIHGQFHILMHYTKHFFFGVKLLGLQQQQNWYITLQQ
jgi:hypothetical protein